MYCKVESEPKHEVAISLSENLNLEMMTRIAVDKSTDHAKPHSICFFFHNIKDNKRNLCQDLLTIENTDLDLKVHAVFYSSELLVRLRRSFQKLNVCKLAQHTETI